MILECPHGLELYTDNIIEYRPDTLIIVDAVSSKTPPGTIIYTCDIECIDKYTIISTHTIPLHVVLEYIKTFTKNLRHTCLLGIQIKNMGFGTNITPAVMEAGKAVIYLLSQLLKA